MQNSLYSFLLPKKRTFRLSFCKKISIKCIGWNVWNWLFYGRSLYWSLVNILYYEKKKSRMYNKGRNFMAVHSISQSMKFMASYLPSSWQHRTIKNCPFSLSPLSLPISVLLPLCSSRCLIRMEMGSCAWQRWQGNVQFYSTMMKHIACWCSFTVSWFE